MDFVLNGKGVQLKTIQDASNWSAFKSKVKKGLDQLKQAMDNGEVTSGRLDIMMPVELSSEFAQLKNKIYDELIKNDQLPEYNNLVVVIDSFLE